MHMERVIHSMLVLVMVICLSGCAAATRVSGSPDQWVRAKRLAVMVSFTQNKISIRNESTEDVSFLPMKIRGWYKTAGAKEIALNHAEKDVLKPNDSISLSIPPLLQIDAAPQGNLPMQSDDELQKVEVELGQGSNGEIVTIGR